MGTQPGICFGFLAFGVAGIAGQRGRAHQIQCLSHQETRRILFNLGSPWGR